MPPSGGNTPRPRDDRIQRITRSRGQQQIGRGLLRRPFLAFVHAAQHGAVRGVAAAKAMDGAQKLREALEVAAAHKLCADHRRRKPQHLRPIDRTVRPTSASSHPPPPRSARCAPGCRPRRWESASRRQQSGPSSSPLHPCQRTPSVGRCISSRLPVLSSMRSLLIITGADIRSRTCRPRLNSELFL